MTAMIQQSVASDSDHQQSVASDSDHQQSVASDRDDQQSVASDSNDQQIVAIVSRDDQRKVVASDLAMIYRQSVASDISDCYNRVWLVTAIHQQSVASLTGIDSTECGR